MKKYLILVFVLLATSSAFAKKDKKKDDKDFKIDSLLKANDSLRVYYDSLAMVNSMHCDSVSRELNDVYTIIKEKVVKKDFDMERLPIVIDSLIALRDSSFSKYHSNATSLMDSLITLKKENQHLKTTMSGITAEEAAKNRLANELKQLKGLLDAKIITQSEFDIKKTKLLERWQ